jgi:hypothetical protein
MNYDFKLYSSIICISKCTTWCTKQISGKAGSIYLSNNFKLPSQKEFITFNFSLQMLQKGDEVINLFLCIWFCACVSMLGVDNQHVQRTINNGKY